MLDRASEALREVLEQRPAPSDVERLGAARDGQHRHSGCNRLAGDGELGRVQVVPGGSELGMRRLAVGLGVDVRTARQQHAVQVRQKRRDRLDRQRGDDHRDPRRPLDGAQIGQPERHLPPRRLPLRGQLDLVLQPDLGRGDADQRAGACIHATRLGVATCSVTGRMSKILEARLYIRSTKGRPDVDPIRRARAPAP